MSCWRRLNCELEVTIHIETVSPLFIQHPKKEVMDENNKEKNNCKESIGAIIEKKDIVGEKK